MIGFDAVFVVRLLVVLCEVLVLIFLLVVVQPMIVVLQIKLIMIYSGRIGGGLLKRMCLL